MNAHNPRIHPEKQIRMLARNIDTFDFLVPCLIDEQNRLLTGTARVLAADRLGMTSIPVIRISHLSETEKRAFIIADNKLTEMSVWNPDILRTELQFFSDLNIDFDFSILGFETAELDIILDSAPLDEDDSDVTNAVPEPPAVSKPGDLWQAGNHRIYCGDALATNSYEKLLVGALAQLVFTDPPYNVPINGHVGGSGDIKHREFAMACGEMSSGQFTTFLTSITRHLAAHSSDGSLHFICMDWRHCPEMCAAGAAAYSELKNICVWCKNNAGMGSLYRSQHEFVFVFKNGTAPHINNINLGVHGRSRSNVWSYTGSNSFGRNRDELLTIHPTVKPVALVADVIKDASARGDLILDVFGGSGTTLIAAEKTRRRAALMEIDPVYVDRSIRRWQFLTGADAVCARTGATFAQRERTLGHT
jgi:DNA modification methylase